MLTPGRIMDLKFSATVVDTTENFDALNFDSRLCNENYENGEINCLIQRTYDQAEVQFIYAFSSWGLKIFLSHFTSSWYFSNTGIPQFLRFQFLRFLIYCGL